MAAQGEGLIVRIGSKNYGPLDLDQLGKLIVNGDIYASDYVFIQEEARWVMVCELENFSSLIPEPPRFAVEKPFIYTYEFGQQKGPFTKTQFVSKIQTGKLTPYDFICFEGATEWQRIRSIEQFLRYFSLPPEEAPAETPLPSWELEGKGEKVRGGDLASYLSSSQDLKRDKSVEEMLESFNLYEISNDPIWLVEEKGKEFGPYNFEEVGNLFRAGKISDQARVKKVNDQSWRMMSEVPELTSEIVKKIVTEGGVKVQKTFAKRRYPRIPFFNLAQIEGDGASESGNVTNLSEGGCFVETPLAWKVGTGEEVRLTLLPGVFKKPMVFSAEVVAVLKKKPPGVCLKFIEIGEAETNSLRDYISRVVGNRRNLKGKTLE